MEILAGRSLWHTSGQDPLPISWVLVRDPTGSLEPRAFFSTELTATPQQTLTQVIMRWGVEVTFEEVRAHLGFETQRQWNRLAIHRTSPAILGLLSLVTLLAHHLLAPCLFVPPPGITSPMPPFPMSSLLSASFCGPTSISATLLSKPNPHLFQAPFCAALSIPCAMLLDMDKVESNKPIKTQ
jgi:hypothetical protein